MNGKQIYFFFCVSLLVSLLGCGSGSDGEEGSNADVDTYTQEKEHSAGQDDSTPPELDSQDQNSTSDDDSNIADEAQEPIREGISPVGEALDPIREVEEPTDEVLDPIREVESPTDEVLDPIREVEGPTDEVLDPIREVEGPVDGVEEPVAEVEEQISEMDDSVQGTPVNLSVNNQQLAVSQLSWDFDGQADKYIIYASASGNPGTFIPWFETESAETTASFRKPGCGEEWYTVAAVSNGIESEPGPAVYSTSSTAVIINVESSPANLSTILTGQTSISCMREDIPFIGYALADYNSNGLVDFQGASSLNSQAVFPRDSLFNGPVSIVSGRRYDNGANLVISGRFNNNPPSAEVHDQFFALYLNVTRSGESSSVVPVSMWAGDTFDPNYLGTTGYVKISLATPRLTNVNVFDNLNSGLSYVSGRASAAVGWILPAPPPPLVATILGSVITVDFSVKIFNEE